MFLSQALDAPITQSCALTPTPPWPRWNQLSERNQALIQLFRIRRALAPDSRPTAHSYTKNQTAVSIREMRKNRKMDGRRAYWALTISSDINNYLSLHKVQFKICNTFINLCSSHDPRELTAKHGTLGFSGERLTRSPSTVIHRAGTRQSMRIQIF